MDVEPAIAVLLFLLLGTPLMLAIYVRYSSGLERLQRIDRNKEGKRKVPTSGGIFLLPVLCLTQALLLGNFGLALAFALLIAGLIGLIDDLKGTGVWIKVPLMMLPSLPFLLFHSLGKLSLPLPFFLNLFPLFLLLPLLSSFFSNAFNIISGYDGLSPGIALIQLGLLSALAFLNANFLLCTAGMLSLLSTTALFYLNSYPSKILPGNSGTFLLGTLIPFLFIYGGFWLPLIILFLPHIAEFLFKLRYKGKTEVFGVLKNGFITYQGKPKSIVHFLLRIRYWKEEEITYSLLAIEFLLALLSLTILETNAFI